jgi:N utilization substance protein A
MNRDIVESFSDMVKIKGLDKDVLAGILEDVFGILIRKKIWRGS